MGLVLVTAFSLCAWIALWAIGMKSFDAFMIVATVITVAGTVSILKARTSGTG